MENAEKLVAYVIGINMCRIRERKGLTTIETSELLGITETYLKALEAGERLIGTIDVITFISRFNITFEDLLKHHDILTKAFINESDGVVKFKSEQPVHSF